MIHKIPEYVICILFYLSNLIIKMTRFVQIIQITGLISNLYNMLLGYKSFFCKPYHDETDR